MQYSERYHPGRLGRNLQDLAFLLKLFKIISSFTIKIYQSFQTSTAKWHTLTDMVGHTNRLDGIEYMMVDFSEVS